MIHNRVKMKLFIVFFCVLGVTSATFFDEESINSTSTIPPTPFPSSSIEPNPSTLIYMSSSMYPSSISPSSIFPSPSSSSVHPFSTPVPPTQKPTTAPYPYYVSYKLQGADNKTCLMMAGSVEFDITYKAASGKTTAVIKHLPANATASGHCASKNQSTASISLNFDSLTFTWMFDVKKDNSWMATNMTLKGTLKNGNETVNVNGWLPKEGDASALKAKDGHSYLCSHAEKFVLTGNVVVAFNQIQVQPVPLDKGHFSKAEECSKETKASTTSNVVPIAVGCALAGLIVIVLIAYLIGRRKSSSRGYEQV